MSKKNTITPIVDHVDLGKEPRSPFILNWSYMPSGVCLITGSPSNVREYLEDFGVHHACVHYYNFGRMQRKGWTLRGKNTDYLNKKSPIYIDLIKVQNIMRSDMSVEKLLRRPPIRKKINFNHKFVIVVVDKTEPVSSDHRILYVKSYRRLPKAYIKELKFMSKL